MIGENTPRRFIACGVIAALTGGVLTAYFALMGQAGLSLLNLFDAAIFFLLAIGIWRKSRIAAVLALAYDGLNQVIRVEQQGGLSGFGIALAIAFAGAYLMSVIGTFAWHAREPVSAEAFE
jgi:hypothetical protein